MIGFVNGRATCRAGRLSAWVLAVVVVVLLAYVSASPPALAGYPVVDAPNNAGQGNGRDPDDWCRKGRNKNNIPGSEEVNGFTGSLYHEQTFLSIPARGSRFR